MKCPLDEITLIDYLEGELDTKDAASLRRHLEVCAACRDTCREIAGTRRVLAEHCRTSGQAPEGFWEENLAAVAAATYGKPEGDVSHSGWRDYTAGLRWLAAAAIVVLALVGSFRLGLFEARQPGQPLQVAQQSGDERVQVLIDSLYLLAETAHRYNMAASTLQSIESLTAAGEETRLQDDLAYPAGRVYDQLLDLEDDQLQQVLYVLASR
ncbi:MAG: zf-HC2 domain-containing protein [Candidatus Glassbacteria bacterium]